MQRYYYEYTAAAVTYRSYYWPGMAGSVRREQDMIDIQRISGCAVVFVRSEWAI